MLDRATRECRTSPAMQTRNPSSRPKWSRRVRMSRSAWVGCSWDPSPALTTLDGMRAARNAAAPGDQWRMTTMSIRMASMLRAVSTRVSPFDTDDRLAPMLTVSADSLFSANSKETRVRVDGSKKRLTIVLPRSTGTLRMRRSEISLNGSAVSRMVTICSRLSGSRPTRSFPSTAVGRLIALPRRRGPRPGRRRAGGP